MGVARQSVTTSPASHLPHNLTQGLTHDGAAYIEKLLHPVSDATSNGIPTGAEGNIVIAAQRGEYTISLSDYGFAETDTVDVLTWCPPGNNTMLVVAVGKAGVDFRSATLIASGTPTATQVRAHTFSFGHNVLDTFMHGEHVITEDAHFPTVTPPADRYFACNTNANRYTKWRTLGSSLTAYFTAPSLADQGVVYCYNGSMGAAVSEMGIETRRFITTLDATAQAASTPTAEPPYIAGKVHEVVRPTTFRVPFDESEFAALTASPYTSRAVDGFYAIARPTDDEFHWAQRPTMPNLVRVISGDPAGVNFGAYFPGKRLQVHTPNNTIAYESVRTSSYPWNQCDYMMTRIETGVAIPVQTHAVPPWLASLYGSGNPNLFDETYYSTVESDAGYDHGFSHIVSIARGLSPAASWAYKRYLTLECQVSPFSPAKQFSIRPPIRDQAALDLALKLSRELPLVYQAKHNSFATVLHEIASIAKKVVPVIGGVTSVLFPEFAPAIAGVTTGVDAGLGIVSRVTQPKAKAKRAQQQQATKTKGIVIRPKRAVARPRPKRGNMSNLPRTNRVR